MIIRTEAKARDVLRLKPRFNDADQVAAINFLERVDAAVLALATCARIEEHRWDEDPRYWNCPCARLERADVVRAALDRLGHERPWE